MVLQRMLRTLCTINISNSCYNNLAGGTSVLNGMMYHRGHAADYASWGENWSWENNLPFFEMTEGNKEIGITVNGDYHSHTGPLPIQRVSYIDNNFFKYQPTYVQKLGTGRNAVPVQLDYTNFFAVFNFLFYLSNPFLPR